MIEKNKNWMIISIGSLVSSFLSLLLPVVTYTAGYGPDKGYVYSFNILQLMDGDEFVSFVLYEYHGDFLHGLNETGANAILSVLSLIGICAIVLSFVGLRSMSKQYESMLPFRLTLAGIFCTMVPAIALLVAIFMSGDEFYGVIRGGAYVYITPAAMIISCFTVTKRHNMTKEEILIQKEASRYIKPAGDLPEW